MSGTEKSVWYAMSGTETAPDIPCPAGGRRQTGAGLTAGSKTRIVLRSAMQCLILSKGIPLRSGMCSAWGVWRHEGRYVVLSAYAGATRCAVLTSRMQYTDWHVRFQGEGEGGCVCSGERRFAATVAPFAKSGTDLAYGAIGLSARYAYWLSVLCYLSAYALILLLSSYAYGHSVCCYAWRTAQSRCSAARESSNEAGSCLRTCYAMSGTNMP
eukprot:2046787-Rhodomonas_salina.2